MVYLMSSFQNLVSVGQGDLRPGGGDHTGEERGLLKGSLAKLLTHRAFHSSNNMSSFLFFFNEKTM